MTVSTASSTSSTASTTTSSASTSSSSSSTISSSDFLNLLLSELQNQDPLNATSTTDFMNQLTSYANFTEQQSINSSMTSLASSFSSLVTLNSVNYIGHTVEAKTDTATLTNGSATFGYSLSAASSNATITIKDFLRQHGLHRQRHRQRGLEHLHLGWQEFQRHPAQRRRRVHHLGDRDRLRRQLRLQLRDHDRHRDRHRHVDLYAFADRERRLRQRRQHHRRHFLI